MATQNGHKQANVEHVNGTTTITLAGKRGSEENMIACELEGLTGDNLAQRHLFLDFSNVHFLASVELGSLINLHKKVRSSDGRLTLTNVRPEIFEIFVITNLHTLMDVRQNGVGVQTSQKSPVIQP